MPGAVASGKLAINPIRMQQMPAAAAVQATADDWFMPAPARMPGFTTRIYAIVKNVATAPRNSRPTVDCLDSIWK